MATATAEDNVDDFIGQGLDLEIESLRSQVKSLQAQRDIQTSTILSSEAILSRLRSFRPQPSTDSIPEPAPDDNNPLQAVLDQSKKQLNHKQECLYRTCAGITTFKVQDPDPFSIDKGKVLGIRIEAFASGKYSRPYYVFLNNYYKGTQILRIHRHTVPPCIPLAALAAKYLPTPAPSSDNLLKARKQDLSKFVRLLRREIASYHYRVAAIAAMRTACGLDVKKARDKGKGKERIIRDISAADAEAKQIRIEWMDGRIGRAVVNSNGQVEKCIIIGDEGRDRDMERRILSNARIEGLAEMLGSLV